MWPLNFFTRIYKPFIINLPVYSATGHLKCMIFNLLKKKEEKKDYLCIMWLHISCVKTDLKNLYYTQVYMVRFIVIRHNITKCIQTCFIPTSITPTILYKFLVCTMFLPFIWFTLLLSLLNSRDLSLVSCLGLVLWFLLKSTTVLTLVLTYANTSPTVTL